jgi:hypothetical protein
MLQNDDAEGHDGATISSGSSPRAPERLDALGETLLLPGVPGAYRLPPLGEGDHGMLSIDRTLGWDRQAAIRHALARLERLPNTDVWSHDAPVAPDERAAFRQADRARCWLMRVTP